MSLEFKNTIGVRGDVISLQEMVIEAGPGELNCSKLEAVMKLHKLFQMIAEHSREEFLPIAACWVSTPKNPEKVHKQYSISIRSIINYFNRCAFPGTVECHRKDGSTENVGDEFIVFQPGPWMEFIQEHGVAWAPGKGAMLVTDIPLSLLKGGPEPEKIAHGFPYTNAQLSAMQKAAQHFWVDFDRQRPPLQKTISIYIAELLGLDGPNRTTNTLAAAIRPDDAPTER
ncbi:hypothetical protein RNI54_004412 [Pseudomonas putida]|nr:hypothetical protein [Pseudomonas putida]